MYYWSYMYFDPTYILIVIGAVICLAASGYVKGSINKYQKIRNMRGMSGVQAATEILQQNGIYDVQIECLQKKDGDHYDPSSKTLRLSYDNYQGQSIAAVAIAAHECGHAIQHHESYGPLKVRTAMVPVVNIGSFIGFPIILLGVLLSMNQILIQIGIWVFAITVLFQLVTLPVEFNASRRGLHSIETLGLLGTEEHKGAKRVLSAAAFTYVAAAAAAILQLLRLIILYGGKGSRRRR